MRALLFTAIAFLSSLTLASTKTILSCQTVDIETPMDIIQSGDYLTISLRGLDKDDSTGDNLISYFKINPSTADWLGPYDISFKFLSQNNGSDVCAFSTDSNSVSVFSCGSSSNLAITFLNEIDGNTMTKETSSLISAKMAGPGADGTYALTIDIADPKGSNLLTVGGDTDESLDYSPSACSLSH